MLLHDIIKIHLIGAGYLPNYPYHMISTKEMCDAFICEGDAPSFFFDTYNPYFNTTDEVKAAYLDLVDTIIYYVYKLKYAEIFWN